MNSLKKGKKTRKVFINFLKKISKKLLKVFINSLKKLTKVFIKSLEIGKKFSKSFRKLSGWKMGKNHCQIIIGNLWIKQIAMTEFIHVTFETFIPIDLLLFIELYNLVLTKQNSGPYPSHWNILNAQTSMYHGTCNIIHNILWNKYVKYRCFILPLSVAWILFS